MVAALEKKTRIQSAYVNCWNNPSCHSVLDALCHEFRILGAEARSVPHKLNKLHAAFAKDIVVLILDEIDRLPLRDRNDLLYAWAEAGNVGVVALSYRRDSYLQLDKRVRSRLNPLPVPFKAFTRSETEEILRSRAAEGLLPDA